MKKILNVLALFVCFLLITSVLACKHNVSSKKSLVGTVIELGEYPQTILPESATISIDETAANSRTQGMFTYYLGSDGAWYYKATENAIDSSIKYSDGSFAKTGGTSTRWFKVEPIRWRILSDNYNGKKLVFCENILDACSFFDYGNMERKRGSGPTEKTIYPNNYEESRIRAFLNGLSYTNDAAGNSDTSFVGKGFLQTAFTDEERVKILNTLVDNSVSSTDNSFANDHLHPNWDVTPYLCDDTTDKIFLLGIKESEQYGVANLKISDFVLSKGMEKYFNKYTQFTRSPCSEAWQKNYVFIGGGLASPTSFLGLAPALCID